MYAAPNIRWYVAITSTCYACVGPTPIMITANFNINRFVIEVFWQVRSYVCGYSTFYCTVPTVSVLYFTTHMNTGSYS